jgi:hypothetical protein
LLRAQSIVMTTPEYWGLSALAACSLSLGASIALETLAVCVLEESLGQDSSQQMRPSP